MNSPCTIEIILTEKEGIVPKPGQEMEERKKKVSKKKLARQRLMGRGE